MPPIQVAGVLSKLKFRVTLVFPSFCSIRLLLASLKPLQFPTLGLTGLLFSLQVLPFANPPPKLMASIVNVSVSWLLTVTLVAAVLLVSALPVTTCSPPCRASSCSSAVNVPPMLMTMLVIRMSAKLLFDISIGLAPFFGEGVYKLYPFCGGIGWAGFLSAFLFQIKSMFTMTSKNNTR